MGSEVRIQGLGVLRPVSLLKVRVAGRGYSLWPEDLGLAGNMQLVEASLLAQDSLTVGVTHTLTQLNTNLALLSLKLFWPHPSREQTELPELTDLYFWHAIVCNTPQTEASMLTLSDLGLSLLTYYETHYAEVGERLAQIALIPTPPNSSVWSEQFFRLPKQLPSSLNPQMRALLTNVRKLVPNVPSVIRPQTSPPPAQRALQQVLPGLAVLGWLTALLLLVLLIVLRAKY